MDGGYTVVFSAPNFRARQDMKLAFVDVGHAHPGDAGFRRAPEGVGAADAAGTLADPANDRRDGETAGAAKRRLRRGVVNVVDVDIPLGMIIPKAKLALVSAVGYAGRVGGAPARVGTSTSRTSPSPTSRATTWSMPRTAWRYFKELVRRDVDGTARDYLLLEYAEGDKLYVPVEQLDRVTRYVGPEGAVPAPHAPEHGRLVARHRARRCAATKKLAFDLVDVYTRRATVQGYRFGPDTPGPARDGGGVPVPGDARPAAPPSPT